MRVVATNVLLAIGWFAVAYVADVWRSAIRVARTVLSPTVRMRPGLVTVPLRARTDTEITAVANLLSLTPGTLAVDITPDRRALVVHAMFADDDLEPQLRAIEDRVLRLLRGQVTP